MFEKARVAELHRAATTLAGKDGRASRRQQTSPAHLCDSALGLRVPRRGELDAHAPSARRQQRDAENEPGVAGAEIVEAVGTADRPG